MAKCFLSVDLQHVDDFFYFLQHLIPLYLILPYLKSTSVGILSPGSGVSAWDEWASALLQKALQTAPLDFAGLWGVAVRFGLNGLVLAGGDSQPMACLLALISEPTAAGLLLVPSQWGCLPSAAMVYCANANLRYLLT